MKLEDIWIQGYALTSRLEEGPPITSPSVPPHPIFPQKLKLTVSLYLRMHLQIILHPFILCPIIYIQIILYLYIIYKCIYIPIILHPNFVMLAFINVAFTVTVKQRADGGKPSVVSFPKIH